MSIRALILGMLDTATEDLSKALSPLKTQMLFPDDAVAVTHNNHLLILVFCTPRLRGYIPKKFNGFEVKTIDWDGRDYRMIEVIQTQYV